MSVQKRILVTGANKGIGFQYVKDVLQRYKGNSVMITSRDEGRGKKAFEELSKESDRESELKIHQLDITDKKSVSNFISHCHSKSQKFDIILHNAGLGDSSEIMKKRKATPEEYDEYMNTNLYSTIDFVENSLPILDINGKCIIASSFVGLLKLQGKEAKEALNAEIKTKEELFEIEKLYKSKWESGDAKWNKSCYSFSKALLNAYNRFILSKNNLLLENSQSSYVYTPGWIQTDMGGKNAPIPLSKGAKVPLYISFDLPFGREHDFHGKFVNEHCKIEPY